MERQDWEAVNAAVEHIYREETAADRIKNDIRDHLPKSIFLPDQLPICIKTILGTVSFVPSIGVVRSVAKAVVGVDNDV